jgi:putative hemolysin
LSQPVFEIVIIVLLVLANGVFAMAEIAVVSARKSRLRHLADEGDAKAAEALRLAEHPNQFLATTQIGITLVGILAGAFGGATIAEKIALRVGEIPSLAPYAASIGLGAVVIVLTFLSLVIGELVPKRLGLNNAEMVARAVARPMRTLSWLAGPVVKVLGTSTDLVIRLLGVKISHAPPVTPEEIRVLIEQGTASGVFHETEQEMIESVLRLDEKPVSAFMTPRTQIVWFDVDDSLSEVLRKMTESPHSRFPVIRENLDDVRGIVRAKDLVARSLASQPFDLLAVLRPALFVPENITALRVLELFKEKGQHVALVTDEYGGIHGMVTHHDVLEAIVGDIPSAGETLMLDATRRADGSWLVDGMMHFDRLVDLLEVTPMAGEELGDYQTVGGFVMSRIGTIPVAGQRFAWRGHDFEVVDMDGRRVDKIIVTPPSAAAAKGPLG